MKRIILLTVLLIVIGSTIVEKTSLEYQIREIKNNNFKDDTLKKWEYVKSKTFNEKGSVQKIYNKPIQILISGYTITDSLIVKDFIKEVKSILPVLKLELIASKKNIKANYDLIDIDFFYKYTSDEYLTINLPDNDGYYRKDYGVKYKNVRTGELIDLSDLRLAYTTRMLRNSNLKFNFNDNISEIDRRRYVISELYRAMFYSGSMGNFSYEFPVGIFNGVVDTDGYFSNYPLRTEYDLFLLQKLYKSNFEGEFNEFMKNYPFRHRINFKDPENYKSKALSVVFLVGIILLILMFSIVKRYNFKYKFLNYLLPIFFFWVLFTNLHGLYGYLVEFNSYKTLEGILFFQGVYVLIISCVSSGLLLLLENIFYKNKLSFSYLIISKVFFTIIALALPIITITIFLILKNDDTKGSFVFLLPILVGITLSSAFRGKYIYLNHFSESQLKQKDVEISKLKTLQAEAETKLLQSQINPHFLYNSLNSIASLAPIDSEKTQNMAHALSDLFKYSINRKDKKMSTVKDEIDMVTSYLEIEKIRFGDRLHFTIAVEDAILNRKIPLFLIQPLVENAVKHGISKNKDKGQITLKIEEQNNNLVITVSDNGPNFPEGLVSGHGLQTVFDLLRLSYGDKAALNWTNTPEKRITITIPETI